MTQWSLHVLLAVLVYLFLRKLLLLAGLVSGSRVLALFGAGLFGLHRVNSETVNFLTLRSEILAALGVAGSFVFYQYAPRWRRTLLWLVPATLGAFGKQSAIVFAPLFASYLLLFPSEAGAGDGTPGRGGRRAVLAFAIPPFLVAGAFYLLQARLGGPRLVYGSTPPGIYLQTQTFAWLHYFRLFLLPLGLSADADWQPIPDWFDTRVFAGAAFALLFAGGAVLYARKRAAGKAFLLGTAWYFIALAPTSSFFALSEMINEHRPYLPYVGLVLCLAAASGDLLLSPGRRSAGLRRLAAASAVLVLSAHAWGVYRRNEAWRNDETLWKSVTEASPGNGRAWMNYGLIFMRRADYVNARACFERAGALSPDYDVLEINRGILDGATGNPASAEAHFRRALRLAPSSAMAHFYYGRWLHENRRDLEAAPLLSGAIEASPADLESRRLLIEVLKTLGDRDGACQAARALLRLAPGDATALAAAAKSCPG